MGSSRLIGDDKDPKRPTHSSRTLGKLALQSTFPTATTNNEQSKMSLVERVRSEVCSSEQEQVQDEDLPIEFGKWTGTISCSSFDGIPTITATENKIIDL
jgi:hypothetical protein